MAEEKKIKMEYRFLGNSGLKVSALSFGNWVTQGKDSQNEELAYQCCVKAYEMGCNFFDTAEVYASGGAEKVLGNVIKRAGWKRSDLVISTKLFWGGQGPNDKGLSRKHIIEGLDASLERLQLRYVDLLFCHRPDPDTPMEETVRAMNHVIDQGKVFYWGTSEWTSVQFTEACEIAHRLGLIAPIVEQPQYNMFYREKFETEYLPLYEHYKMGTTIWSPLAYGLLSGKYNDGIPDDSRFADPNFNFLWKKEYNSDKKGEFVAKLKAMGDIAKELGITQAQLSLAWCLKNPNVTTVITGASKPSQVAENFQTIEVVDKLTPDVMEKLEKILGNKPKAPINWRTFI